MDLILDLHLGVICYATILARALLFFLLFSVVLFHSSAYSAFVSALWRLSRALHGVWWNNLVTT